jgi:hypothetical protein
MFRFIIEYSSLRDFGPCVIGLSLYEDFWKIIFWLVLKLEISYRVIISGMILVSFRGFFRIKISPWMWNYLCCLDYNKRWISLLQCIFYKKNTYSILYTLCVFSWYFCANWVTKVKWIERTYMTNFQYWWSSICWPSYNTTRMCWNLNLDRFMVVKTQTSIGSNVILTKGLKHYWIEWLAQKRERGLPWMVELTMW